ncbi:hypothetical protein [Desulfatitalea alkaliphila]|uniref:Uncharacterized protein n=1 Tax=Desulfatitalea alkaliphila TaxID=2929485 RepID=A0AA41R0L4_9BACT|nr:hypothetical protein [Desulfatitalea alkaliphila]MCJ8499927.1 hypothetical protein [Desulfatitalea alkaliphila]
MTGGLFLNYPPSPNFELSSPETLLQESQLMGTLSATHPALRKITTFHARRLSSRQEIEHGIPMSAIEIEQSTEDTFSQMMIAFHFIPFFAVTEETVESHFEIKEGAIYVDGEILFHLRDLLTLI